MVSGAREAEDPLSPAVQLPSYLCDNTHNVWHESRLYCPTAWTQRPDAALDLCPLVEPSGDWGEMDKLQNAPGMAKAPNARPATH